MIFRPRGYCVHLVRWGEYHGETPSEGITHVKILSLAERERYHHALPSNFSADDGQSRGFVV